MGKYSSTLGHSNSISGLESHLTYASFTAYMCIVSFLQLCTIINVHCKNMYRLFSLQGYCQYSLIMILNHKSTRSSHGLYNTVTITVVQILRANINDNCLVSAWMHINVNYISLMAQELVSATTSSKMNLDTDW